MSQFRRSIVGLSFALVASLSTLAGCSAELDEETESSDDELRALRANEIVGSLKLGETKRVRYSKTPTYRAFKLDLEAGASVDLQVASSDGKPLIYLLSSSSATLARARAGADGRARITRKVQAAGTYYLAVREESFADASFVVSFVDPDAGGRACTTDDQCGGGATCFIDRCKSVNESRRTAPGVTGVLGAYDGDGALEVLFSAYSPRASMPEYSHERRISYGPWAGPFTSVDTSTSWRWDHAPGTSPERAWFAMGVGRPHALRYGTYTLDVPSFPYDLSTFAVAKNGAGTRFAAVQVHARSGAIAPEECILYFASQRSGAAWSPLEKVSGCSGHTTALHLHVRSDGGADIVSVSSDTVFVRTKKGRLDGWSLDVLPRPYPVYGLEELVFAHGVDGVSHLLISSRRRGFTATDYASRYVELNDGGVVARQVDLGEERDLPRNRPYAALDSDEAGNVWVAKQVLRAGANGRAFMSAPSIVRIDPRGNVAERAIPSLHDATVSDIAVSESGEIALLHRRGSTVNGGALELGLLRLTPAR